MLAASHGYTDIVVELVKAGANFNLQNKKVYNTVKLLINFLILVKILVQVASNALTDTKHTSDSE